LLDPAETRIRIWDTCWRGDIGTLSTKLAFLDSGVSNAFHNVLGLCRAVLHRPWLPGGARTDEICETDPVDAETPQSPRLLQMMWNSYMTEFVQVEQCALVSQALDYFID